MRSYRAAVAIAPDGNFIAYPYWVEEGGQGVYLMDARTGESLGEPITVYGEKRGYSQLYFTEDSQTLITDSNGYFGRRIHFYDVSQVAEAGTESVTLLRNVRYYRDGQRPAFTVSDDGNVAVLPPGHDIYSLPDQDALASGAGWQPPINEDYRGTPTIETFTDERLRLHFRYDHYVRYDMTTGQRLAPFENSYNRFLLAGDYGISGQGDIRRLNDGSEALVTTVTDFDHRELWGFFGEDQLLTVFTDYNAHIAQLQVRSFPELEVVEDWLAPFNIRAWAYQPDHDLLALAYGANPRQGPAVLEANRIELLRWSTRERLALLETDGRTMRQLWLSSDGRLLVGISNEAEVVFWNVPTAVNEDVLYPSILNLPENLLESSYRTGNYFPTPALSPDGQLLAVNAADGGILFWKTEDLLAGQQFPSNRLPVFRHLVHSFAFNSSGTLIATSSGGHGTVMLWGVPASGE
jgi:WD40 repeat protein